MMMASSPHTLRVLQNDTVVDVASYQLQIANACAILDNKVA
jgi:hypothetical protein